MRESEFKVKVQIDAGFFLDIVKLLKENILEGLSEKAKKAMLQKVDRLIKRKNLQPTKREKAFMILPLHILENIFSIGKDEEDLTEEYKNWLKSA